MKRLYWIVLISIFLSACGLNSVNSKPATQSPTPSQSSEISPSTPFKLTPPATITSAPNIKDTDQPPGLKDSPALLPESTPSADAGFPSPDKYIWRTLAEGLAQPVSLAHAGDNSGRLFLVEKVGLIRIYRDNEGISAPFLDITDRVGSKSSEQGLLGMAFHPDFKENGLFYVNYTDLNGDTVISRFQVSEADPDRANPASEAFLLSVPQPYPNHNGGNLAFGPDNYLYIGLGDGGSAGDPQNNAQSLQTHLGKILRIDVDNAFPFSIPKDNIFTANQRPEIWAYGLRNPWRFSFDRLTGDLYIGDVGQNQWEEINYLPFGSPAGANFGWRYFEGTHPFSQEIPPGDLTMIAPVTEYSHAEGCSVIGGVVYRGNKLPEWNGVYFFGDYCSGTIFGLRNARDGVLGNIKLFENNGLISAFGEDEQGEIYLLDYNGRLMRLEPRITTVTSARIPESQSNFNQKIDLNQMSHYPIDLDIDFEGNTFIGVSRPEYTNSEDPLLDHFYFRLISNGRGTYRDGTLELSRVDRWLNTS